MWLGPREPVLISGPDNIHFPNSREARSILCLPIEHLGRLTALLYLENDQAPTISVSIIWTA